MIFQKYKKINFYRIISFPTYKYNINICPFNKEIYKFPNFSYFSI